MMVKAGLVTMPLLKLLSSGINKMLYMLESAERGELNPSITSDAWESQWEREGRTDKKALLLTTRKLSWPEKR